MSSARHITLEERKMLESGLKKKMSYGQIAREMNRPKTTIKNEIYRWPGAICDYDAELAHNFYIQRKCGRIDKLHEKMYVSEEQIAIFKTGYANGYSINKICSMASCGKKTYHRWIQKNKDNLPKINAVSLDDRVSALEMTVKMLINKINKNTG